MCVRAYECVLREGAGEVVKSAKMGPREEQTRRNISTDVTDVTDS